VKKKKLEKLIEYSISTFENSNAEDVQTNARKSMEAFWKLIILHRYGEERGERIFHYGDTEFNEKIKATKAQKRNKQEFPLSMLQKVVIDHSDIINWCYQKHFKGTELSKVLRAKKEELHRLIQLLTFNGNSSAHESSIVVTTREDVIITRNIMIKLLRWLYTDYLETDIPQQLMPYIGRYDIFLSYRHVDAEWINTLKENLENQGYTLFIDSYEITVGESLSKRLREGIEQSSCAILLSSSNDDAPWIAHELKWMKEREKNDSSFKIIPLVVNGANSPLDADIHYIDFSQKEYVVAFNDLIRAIPIKRSFEKEIKLPNTALAQTDSFVDEVMEKLEEARALKLFSRDFTQIDKIYESIRNRLKKQYGEYFYHVSVPSFTSDEESYFSSVAKSCGIETKVTSIQEWKDAMEVKLKSSKQVVLLLSDFESANEDRNRELASTLRSLHSFCASNFFVLFVGRKSLGKLTFPETGLSPLKSLGGHLFFPDNALELDNEKIVQIFENLSKHKSYLCRLLTEKRIRRYAPWVGDKLINKLFWKNLLREENGYLVWRSEEIMELGKEVLGCDSV